MNSPRPDYVTHLAMSFRATRAPATSCYPSSEELLNPIVVLGLKSVILLLHLAPERSAE